MQGQNPKWAVYGSVEVRKEGRKDKVNHALNELGQLGVKMSNRYQQLTPNPDNPLPPCHIIKPVLPTTTH